MPVETVELVDILKKGYLVGGATFMTYACRKICETSKELREDHLAKGMGRYRKIVANASVGEIIVAGDNIVSIQNTPWFRRKGKRIEEILAMYRGVPQQVIRCVKDFPPAHRSELMRRMLKEPY